MSAPEGNTFYRLRKDHGRKPVFNDPEQLIDACNAYFEFIDKTPLQEEVMVRTNWTEYKADPDNPGKTIKIVHGHAKESLSKKRPYTIDGLCIHMGIGVSTFYDYEKKDGFSEIVTHIRTICRNQKFEGAAAGFFQQNIVARDLGLIDRKDHTTKGKRISGKIEVNIKR